MKKKELLGSFAKSTLVASLLLPMLTMSAYAQEEAAKEEQTTKKEKVEKIEVTGSRIKRIDLENATPITVYTKEDIEKTGQVTVADFLRGSDASTGLTTENATLSQVSGAAAFSGRGFNSSYTLVLLNGRRMPTNAIAADFADINQIPMAAVERIEYVTDGASAIYGADAVAGVLNIITKKEYNGVSASYQTGAAFDGQGFEQSYQAVAGTSTDKTSVLVSYDYFKRDPIFGKDRPLAKSTVAPVGDFDDSSAAGLPGFVIFTDPNSSNAGKYQAFDDCKNPTDVGGGNTICYFDFGPIYEVQPKSERQNFFGTFNHKINEDLSLFGELRYSKSYTQTRNGASPTRQGDIVLGANAPTDDELAVYAGQLGVTVEELKKVQFNNPYGEEVNVVRRFLDFGPRARDNTNETFAVTAGLKGSVGFYDWELGVQRAYLRNLQVGAGGQLNSEAATAAFSSGVLNPFVSNVADTEIKQKAFDAINTNTFREGYTVLKTVDLTVTGPIALNLPGGEMAFAAGLYGMVEEFTDKSDRISSLNKIYGGASSDGGGKRQGRAAFVELNLPVLSMLDVNVAARYDDLYATGKNSTYKGSFALKPIKQLLVRGSYGTGFKAPDLHDLYLGQSFGYTDAIDTKVCDAAKIDNSLTQAQKDQKCASFQIPSSSGGNIELKPEKSNAMNFGIIGQITDELSVGTDYWAIAVKDQIGSLGVQEILNNYDDAAISSLIVRDANGELKAKGAVVKSNSQNINEAKSSGLEFNTKYLTKTSIGDIGVDLQLSKLLKYERQTSATQPLCDTAKYSSMDGKLGGSWNNKTFSVSMQVDYRGSYKTFDGGYVDGTCDWKEPDTEYSVKSNTELGTQFGYNTPWGTKLALGVNNLTNEAPAFDPYVAGGWPWYSQSTYRNTGRFMYVKMSQDF